VQHGEHDDRDEPRPAGRVPEGRARDECAHHDAPEVTVGAVLDAATVVGVVADVPDVLAALADDLDDAEEAVEEFDEVAVACVAVVVAVPVVAPAWAASPANRPVPVSAPASDQRVRCLMRRRPASRFLRLLAFSLC
jgi:hypothetical protein